jgi:hypothetical protein
VLLRKHLLFGPAICPKVMEEMGEGGAWLSKGLKVSF